MKSKAKNIPKQPRVSPKGKSMGATMAQLADQEVRTLIAQGEYEEDERCRSCAFRAGTVPNGCLQTQMDVMKAVLERKPFMCHEVDVIGTKVCAGWFAATQAAKRNSSDPISCPWEFSPVD